MAKSIIFQGVTQETHLTAVKHILSIPGPQRAIINAAFVLESGLRLLEEAIAPVAKNLTIIAGIRNDITSAQGLLTALEFGCRVFVVDTGSRSVIFHPKIYFAKNAGEARVIIGSANLTYGGLNSNIEASLLLTLPLSEPDNSAFVSELEGKIDSMLSEYDEHIFEVNKDKVEELFATGRIVDEVIVRAPKPTGSSKNRDFDTVPRMKLRTTPVARPKVAALAITSSNAPASPPVSPTPISVGLKPKLVWQSSPLTRRYLNIPTGAKTNPTGSMLFTKGMMEEIDQRHYFRDDVFAGLNWANDTDPRRKHLERATAKFQLVIRNVDYGVFELRLTHNTRTDTASYEQSNSMTQLHWGTAHSLVAREDLLERTLSLYRDESDPGLFVLEID
jgi:HKD family nuclease